VVEPAEAEVAVSHQRLHAAGFGKAERFAVVGFRAHGVEAVVMGRDVAEQVHGMRGESLVRRRVCDSPVGQL
jgi:hypothetical protein